MKTLFPCCCLIFLTACATTKTQISHLGPLPQAAQVPAACKVITILPDSPAAKAGLRRGETIIQVNNEKPADAASVSDMIQRSGPEAVLVAADASGKSRVVKVSLNKEKPRLGASCDLSGWRKNSVSAAGNEAVTLFQGPYALTVSGIIDKKIQFMRVRISNHSDRPLAVSPSLFSAWDGTQAPMRVLSPQEVIYFMHGEGAVPLITPPQKGPPAPSGIPADSPVRAASPEHKRKEDWSPSDQNYVQANAKYLNTESLWPTTVAPGEMADGLIYFLEPKQLPFKIQARVEEYTLSAEFGTPQPAATRMTIDELVSFFESQKKGTPVRLTLKRGKVFVGRYSSYDAINEIAWFDTPSGVLLTTSSFGLKHIAHAEVVSSEPDKKKPASETVN